MKFQSRINPFFLMISFLLICILIFYYFISTLFLFSLTFLMTVLLIIMLLREYYRINTYLEVYRGFTRIKVDIMQIEMMNIAMYGSRPGVEISGNERHFIVFPVETELFVKTLLTINPDIYLQNQQNMDVLRCNF